ncbi:hypothetical protein HY448_01295 [Candidatus Pacearchaeota archaeon]|nr:hypothetical protein [Candidatus Pacearchaeota archaeon]
MKCRWLEAVLAALILVFSLWPTQILSAMYSWWVVVVSAALLLVHSLFCHKCEGVCVGWMKGGKKKR